MISKEGIKHFLEETESGPAIGTEFYDADITSPIEALRHIIQKNYTPNITSELKVAKYAVVVAADELRSPLINVIKKEDPSRSIQLVRVRVLSDPRHFWIPVPSDPWSLIILLHNFLVMQKWVEWFKFGLILGDI